MAKTKRVNPGDDTKRNRVASRRLAADGDQRLEKQLEALEAKVRRIDAEVERVKIEITTAGRLMATAFIKARQ